MEYSGREKASARTSAFSTAVESLIIRGISSSNIRALILVDGTLPQAYDVEVLEAIGVHRSNITAVSRRWADSVKCLHYQNVNIYEGDIATWLQQTRQKKDIHIVYLDFCKPLLNELNEKQATCLFELFERTILAPEAVLIQTHNINVYFHQESSLYIDFMRAYGSPDYFRSGNVTRMSVRTLTSSTMYVGDDLFTRDGYLEQKVRILSCFIDGFVRDVAEVYVPHSRNKMVHSKLLEDLEQACEGNQDTSQLPPELQEAFKKKNMLLGRMAQCVGLLRDCPEKTRKLLSKITGSFEEMMTAAAMAEWYSPPINLTGIYRPTLNSVIPYVGGKAASTHMLTMVWTTSLTTSTSHLLWGLQSRR